MSAARIADLDEWLRDLTDGLPRGPRQYEFRCHPDVFAAIREAADVPSRTPAPGARMYGSPAFGSADVLVQPELGAGHWELYEHGELLKSGQLASGESYTCDRCGGTFEKVRSDEEAMTEARSLWTPETMADEQAVICDDCFREFMEWAKVNVPEALR